MGNWVTLFDIDFSQHADVTSANMATAFPDCYAPAQNYEVKNGLLRRADLGGPANNPLVFGPNSFGGLVKVEITTGTLPAGNTAGGYESATRIWGIGRLSGDHMIGGGISYSANFGEFITAAYANFGATGNESDTFSGGYGGTVRNIVFEVTAPGDTVKTTIGGQTKTMQTDFATSGVPGVLISGSTDAGIAHLKISRFDSDAPSAEPLALTNPTGFSEFTAPFHISVPGPTYSGGVGPVSYQWRYFTDIMDETGTPIPGKSGAAANGVVPALEWDVPSNLRNAFLWVAPSLSDGVTSFSNVGHLYNGQYFQNNIYTPAFVPPPPVPTDGDLTALFSRWSDVDAAGGIVLSLLGDSLTNQAGGQFQSIFNAVSGNPSRATEANYGHAGTNWADWLPSAPVSGGGISFNDGSQNNYNKLKNDAVAAVNAGKKVYVSICLGTNGGANDSARDTIIAALQADIPGVKIVLQDLLYFAYRNNNHAFNEGRSLEAGLHAIADASPTDAIYPGTRLTPAYYAAHHELMDGEGRHASGSLNQYARFQIAPVFAAMEATIPVVTPPPTLTGITVIKSGPNSDGDVIFSAAPVPSGASISSGTWATNHGSLTASGTSATLDASTLTEGQMATVTYTSGQIVGTQTYLRPVTTPPDPPVTAATSLALVVQYIAAEGQDHCQMGRYAYMQNDTEPGLLVRFVDADHHPISLSGCDVTLDMWKVGSGTLLLDQAPCELISAPLGYALYSWGPSDLSTPGSYRVRFYRIGSSGRSSTGTLQITIEKRLQPPAID